MCNSDRCMHYFIHTGIIFSIILHAASTNTINIMIDGSDSVCFGQQVRLLCIYPVIDPTMYYPKASWSKNGEEYFPDGIIEREATVNNMTIALYVLITREEFGNVNTITFGCFLRRRDFKKEKSNAVSINPTGLLYIRCCIQ